MTLQLNVIRSHVLKWLINPISNPKPRQYLLPDVTISFLFCETSEIETFNVVVVPAFRAPPPPAWRTGNTFNTNFENEWALGDSREGARNSGDSRNSLWGRTEEERKPK
jgi:hypothetical protein